MWVIESLTACLRMTGGIGGFYLASTLGLSKQATGSFQFGFLGFACLALVSLLALLAVGAKWRATWLARQSSLVQA